MNNDSFKIITDIFNNITKSSYDFGYNLGTQVSNYVNNDKKIQTNVVPVVDSLKDHFQLNDDRYKKSFDTIDILKELDDDKENYKAQKYNDKEKFYQEDIETGEVSEAANKYKAGSKLKDNPFSIGGGLWEVDKDINGNVYSIGDPNAQLNFLNYSVSDGKIEGNLLQGKLSVDEEYADKYGGVTKVYADAVMNIGHGKATGTWEIGPNKVAIGAAAEVSAIQLAAQTGEDYSLHLGDHDYKLFGSKIKGNLDVCKASAAANAVAGIYKDEDGNMHLDAGVNLDAKAELVSGSVSQSVNVLGVEATGSIKGYVGAGATLSAGIQDGKLNFKAGVGLGVGAEVDFSVDVGGLVENVKNVASDIANNSQKFFDDVGNTASKVANDIGKAATDIGDGIKSVGSKIISFFDGNGGHR